MEEQNKKKKMNFFNSFLFIAAVSYLIVMSYVYLRQTSYIFMPTKEMAELPKDLPVRELSFKTEDNETLHAWHLEVDKNAKTVLFFHGNYGNLSGRIIQLQYFKSLGLNCLIFDYRGYGKSTGKIKREEDLYIDSRAAYSYLINDLNIPEKNIILWGRSVGSALATDLAVGRHINSLIIESPFFSAEKVAKENFQFFPVDLLLKYHFRNDQKIQRVIAPILIIHGEHDKMIPIEHGKKLHELVTEKAQFLELDGGHNDMTIVSTEKYLKSLKEFLQ